MTGDCTFCSAFTQQCPKTCYRAQITRELMAYNDGKPHSFANFKGSDECTMTHGDAIRSMTDEEIARMLHCIQLDMKVVCENKQRESMFPTDGKGWYNWTIRGGRV